MTHDTTIDIVHADALSFGAELFSACDVLIADFPYSPHVHENAVSANSGGRGYVERDLGFEPLTPELRAHGALAMASVKRWGVVFSDHEGTHLWRDAVASAGAGARYIRTIPWVRWSQPQKSGDRPGSQSEAVLHFHSRREGGPMHWNGSGSLMYYDERSLRGKDKHKTEKPIDLMLTLVSAYSDPGETVLDMVAGRGTTALACRMLGRSCVAIERDGREASLASARCEAGAVLSLRDRARAEEWCEKKLAEAGSVPEPRKPDGSDVKTWERAQRRIADVMRVAAFLE